MSTLEKKNILAKGGTLFAPELVHELFSKVKGKSALAALCAQTPIPFNGTEEWVFTMDDEVDLVAEGGVKGQGHADLAPRKIVPLKIEYSIRVSNEFLYAEKEEQISILRSFLDGFAKKAARGLDIMAFHGLNPRSKQASSLIGDNHFDNGVTIIKEGADADQLIENAIAEIMGKDYDVDGIAISPAFRSDLSKLVYADGRKMFPDLTWGGMAGKLNGLNASCNNTVSFNESPDLAVIGAFGEAFKWGYAKDVITKIIEYGDPDNTGKDLQAYNQVCIRCEAFIGWGILDKSAFAVIQPPAESYALTKNDKSIAAPVTVDDDDQADDEETAATAAKTAKK